MKCLDETGPAVISAQKSPDSLYGGFSAVNVVLKKLDIRTSDNPGIGGVDLGHALQCKLQDVFINTGVCNVRAAEPTRGTSGLITPACNNAAWTILRNVTVTGYRDGIVVNEHTDGDNIVIGNVGARDVFIKKGGASIRARRIGAPPGPEEKAVADPSS